ncbi:hypothetical protein BDY19DRAFT_343649 [Irpex rosettiformis]|uniref:Uncharacterized protein n=1 Tax=Irpex rosettiformis TaxID=378272 RepID=A0ACB8TWQ4_9APHY|nr:hypothetical protein BDY19DRAFT_343649 [Irpex rosettiformis]
MDPLSSSPQVPPDGEFELDLRSRHLEELRQVEIPVSRMPPSPWPSLPGAPSPYDQLVQWSKQALPQIQAAVARQAISPDGIDWEIEVFTLLESAAVYLRDMDKVFEAVIEAQKGTDEGDERALQLLKDSQSDIKKIASLWGLNFEVVCDLLKYTPEGHPFLNGPYVGVFFSKNINKPFLGLAFKGTNIADWREVLVDLKFALIMATGNNLWGSPIHRGFYQTMFLKFPHVQQAPIDYIKNMIDKFLVNYPVPPGIPIYLHSTGHSLGGAYATLCYAELMRLSSYNLSDFTASVDTLQDDEHGRELGNFFSQLKARNFLLRDLYSFGCPRLGGVMNKKDWASQYTKALYSHTGKSWRVVNEYDPVTAVPPVIPWSSTPWNHVDNGYQVSNKGYPKALPSEVGTRPGISIKPWNFPYHSTAKYFQNLYNASIAGMSGDEAKPITVDWVEEVPPEEVWSEMEAEAQALLATE